MVYEAGGPVCNAKIVRMEFSAEAALSYREAKAGGEAVRHFSISHQMTTI